jgi:site-specific DNA recombinase
LQKLAIALVTDPLRLGDVSEALRKAEQRTTTVNAEILKLEREHIDQSEVAAAALAAFDPLWGELSPKEQPRLIQLLVARVAYDGKQGTVAITFHPSGIKTLAAETDPEEAA